MKTDNFTWNLGDLPFVLRPLAGPSNGKGIPDKMPFILHVSNETGVIMQLPNEDVYSVLSEAYKRGSMLSGSMDDKGIGRLYADDFLSFVMESVKGRPIAGLKVMEIGCGTGYLLHRLKVKGAKVLGIEPGMQARKGSNKYDVPVIQDFFPSDRIKGTFDIIIAYSVLEHSENPVDFMKFIRSFLSEDGIVLLSVPDCGPYLECGDISFLLHEHWSYFTEDSLNSAIRCSGGDSLLIKRSGYGGALYASVAMNGAEEQADEKKLNNSNKMASKFRDLAMGLNGRLSDYISSAVQENQSVGIYVPGRVINALALEDISVSHCRFFDDNPVLQGTYFPCFDIPVESRKDLIDRPTDHVLIMSLSFGPSLAKELKGLSSLSKSRVATINDLSLSIKWL